MKRNSNEKEPDEPVSDKTLENVVRELKKKKVQITVLKKIIEKSNPST